MSATGRALGILGVTVTLAACGGSPPPAPAKPVAAPAPKPGTPPAAPKPVAAVQAGAPAKPGTAPVPVPGSAQVADAIRAAAQTIAPPKPKYEVRGRRDPFENLDLAVKEREAAAGFSVAATKLTGIVQGRAPLALVETAEGHGYILKPGDMLGDGRVVEIGRDKVVFAVPPKPGSPNNRVVLRLAE